MAIISSAFAVVFLLIGVFVFSLLFRIMLVLTVGFDCRSKGVKDKTVWMVLTFFFPIIVGIIYACRCNDLVKTVPKLCTNCNTVVSSQESVCPNCHYSMFVDYQLPDKDKNIKKRKTSLIISIVAVVLSVACSVGMICAEAEMLGGWDALKNGDMTEFYNNLDELEQFDDFDDNYDIIDDYDTFNFDDIHYGYEVNGETVYYDKMGKAYTDDDDVLYYDSEGRAYEFDYDKYVFEDEQDKTYSASIAYVDENGDLYFDVSGDIQPSDDYYIEFKDSDGKVYYTADYVSWDKDGNMVDFEGEPIK